MVGHPPGTGWVEVICGPMFSGKTEELIRRLRRATYARQGTQVFKPLIDDRYAEDALVTHSAQRLDALAVSTAGEILEHVHSFTDVVGVDEAQFFDDGLIEVTEVLAARGARVIVAGLDTDYLGAPFEPVPSIMARAEYVTKLLAICVRCAGPACRSLRIVDVRERIQVGAADRYEAVCRACHERLRAREPSERKAAT